MFRGCFLIFFSTLSYKSKNINDYDEIVLHYSCTDEFAQFLEEPHAYAFDKIKMKACTLPRKEF
jgi:hypothetical protein